MSFMRTLKPDVMILLILALSTEVCHKSVSSSVCSSGLFKVQRESRVYSTITFHFYESPHNQAMACDSSRMILLKGHSLQGLPVTQFW